VTLGFNPLLSPRSVPFPLSKLTSRVFALSVPSFLSSLVRSDFPERLELIVHFLDSASDPPPHEIPISTASFFQIFWRLLDRTSGLLLFFAPLVLVFCTLPRRTPVLYY